jgi:hypothetical protein
MGDRAMNFHPVIAGLDPAIHQAKPENIFVLMDARVKPAHDGAGGRFLLSANEVGRSRDDQA